MVITLALAAAGPFYALFWAITSRVAYIAYIGVSLRRARMSNDPARQTRDFVRFRDVALLLMTNDGVAIVVLAIATRDTLGLPRLPTAIVGGFLVVVGCVCKVWAGKALGFQAWVWQDFFIPPAPGATRWNGPYRFLNNPMYSVGYIQAWALPLMLRSWPGLVAGLFAHMTILVFCRLVEGPHARAFHVRGFDAARVTLT